MRISSALVLLMTLAALAPRAAAAGPCDDLATPRAADACVAAFIADPGGPSSLGADPGNFRGVGPRIGDLGFVVAFGRAPGPQDDEATRVRAHMDLVLRILRARPATSPALAERRAHILDLLEDYRDKGTVPANVAVDHRAPVFIDDAGRICAVGYLVQETAGRPLAEAIAARFRFDYLRDMAMPELSQWIAGSGLTLDELALIQPAYSLPPLDSAWTTFVGPLRLGAKPPNGAFTVTDAWSRTTRGAWKGRHMDGHWERKNADGAVVGSGDFVRGKGDWRAFNADGTLAAEGHLERNAPEGVWRSFYPSGRLAADGHFHDGVRSGLWSYYFDVPGEVLMARGKYDHDEIGKWEHYDRLGRHIATSDTKKDVVTWYDAAGRARAVEGLEREDGMSRPDAVEWGSDGLVAYERMNLETAYEGPPYSQLELAFDGAGHLTQILVRGTYDVGAVVKLVDGRVTEASRRDDGENDQTIDQRLALAGLDTPALARLVAEAERSARDHRRGPSPVARTRLERAATPFLALVASAPVAGAAPELAAALSGHEFAPSFPSPGPVPALWTKCPEDGASTTTDLCRYEDDASTDAAGQVQRAVLHVPTMVTSGTNFFHLDVIGHRMMGFMVDRIPSFYDDQVAMPEWMLMPPYRGSDDDTFGERSSTWAPMIGAR